MSGTRVEVFRFELSRGVRAIALPMAGKIAASVGVWVFSGSAHEPNALAGISHFIEHLVFKGTRNYDARAIVTEIESRGGGIDAYTSREETCYQATVVGEDLEVALRILADLVCRPLFREEDIELERGVVLSEMREVRETPSVLAQDIFPLLLFGDIPLARPILGAEATVKLFERKTIAGFWQSHYVGENILVGASGAVEPHRFAELVEKYFDPRRGERLGYDVPEGAPFAGKVVVVPYGSQQVHVLVGWRTFPYSDDRRYSLAVADAVLGRGSASRLFQRIREELGLVYDIHSFAEYYSRTGFWGIYAAAAPENAARLLRELRREVERLSREPVPDDELVKAKNFLRGRLLLSTESSWNMLVRAAEGEYYLGRFVPIDETIERLMSVQASDVLELAAKIAPWEKATVMVLGEIDARDLPDVGLKPVQKTVEDVFPLFEAGPEKQPLT